MKRENCKPEAFKELVVRYRMRMETLRGILDVDGRIHEIAQASS
jgi:hypothetical protein